MTPLYISLAVLAVYMTALFLLSLYTKNNGIADVGYGGAVMLVVAVSALQLPPFNFYALALMVLPFIWGSRLALRIYLKNRGKPEDFRYRAWRESWGRTFVVRSFLQIYMLQGLVAFVVALPVVLALLNPAARISGTVVSIGIAIWVIGFLFETIADWQLDRFIRNPENKGRIMTRGLWRFSRHPNYFGESLMWWGIAFGAVGLTNVFLLGFLSPLLITFLLIKVSGVPMLEKRWEGNPEWEAYKARTSVFIPLLPKLRSVPTVES